MQFSQLETLNYNFKYIELGDGFPLIFMHGYPGRPQNFRRIFPYLSDFKIISIALPCLDYTTIKDNRKPPTTIEERVDSVDEFLEKKNIKQCLVIAHSMAGPIGAALTKRNSEKILGLVLIASVGLYPYKAFRKSKPDLAYKLISTPVLRNLFKPLMKHVFYRLRFPKGISVHALNYVLHCAHDFSFVEHSKNITSLSCPILNIWSEDDHMIEMQSQIDLSEALQKGSNLKFKTGGHNPQKEFPEQMAFGIKDWMKKSGLSAKIQKDYPQTKSVGSAQIPEIS